MAKAARSPQSPRLRRQRSFATNIGAAPAWADPRKLVQGPAAVDRLQARIEAQVERARAVPALRWLLGLFAAESPFWSLMILIVPFAAMFITLTVGKWFTGAPLVDFDYWWHLATGNWILDHHRVPTTDPFSWTAGGRNWIAHEWLAEVLLALVVRAGGYAAAIVFTAALVLLGYWRLLTAARWYGMSRRLAFIVTVGLSEMFLRGGVMVVRPQVWTFALFGILLAQIAAHDTGRHVRSWVLPLLFVVWVNANLTVFLGIAFLGMYAVDLLIRKRLDRRFFLICVASGVALLVNYRGPVLIISALRNYFDQNAIWYQVVFEWQHPLLQDHSMLPLFVSVALLPLMLWPLIQRRPRIWPALPCLIMLWSSYKAIRFVPIYGIMLFLFIGWLFWWRSDVNGVRPAAASQPLVPTSNWWLPVTNIAIVIILLLPVTRASSQYHHDPNAFGYPVGATDYLIEHYPTARIFNDYNYGGYLVYRFSESGTPLKVYVDGRTEMYGDAFVRHYFDIAWAQNGPNGWKASFEQEGFTAAIMRTEMAVAPLIAADPDWKIAWVNQDSVLFVKKSFAAQFGG
jgi:hypothetical protein